MATDAASTPAKLEDQLCFALYAASRAITGTYRPKLAELGLTYPQYIVLLRLWQQDGTTVSELGGALSLDSGTLSPILKRLENQGLVRKERNNNDERSVTIWCTTAGHNLEEPARQVRENVECSTGLDDEAMASLRAMLQSLQSQLST